ncbi:hypothetical protein QUF54_03630 [Candidatus Marithioploca araucensis]|uniref:Uncharacterized protein n=1 Tax=Candidatus Marithioploca araucensis TaxID=70273 RepID=A0ABT7VRX7_9GAMM|nr:hypothetical protein [Candidatus Marithioploca araucensis]
MNFNININYLLSQRVVYSIGKRYIKEKTFFTGDFEIDFEIGQPQGIALFDKVRSCLNQNFISFQNMRISSISQF